MRVLLAAVAAALVPAAGAQAATLAVDRPCVAAGERATLTGTGFAPGGAVALTFTRSGATAPVATATVTADPSGAVRFTRRLPVAWLASERADRLDVTLGDARAEIRFVRREVSVGARGGRIAPDRPVTFAAGGFTTQRGRTLHAHWVRAGRRVRSVRLGRLRGSCGTVIQRLRRGFPFRPVDPGTWHVAFNTSAANPRAPGTVVVRAARVKRRIP